MSRLSLREKLLEAGVTVLHQRGYSACGVRESPRRRAFR